MGSTRVECRKKGRVRQVKALGGKVGQDVGGAWNVETLRNIAVGPLVKARSAEQIGRRARGGDGAFGAPGDGGCVVTEGSHCELAEVVVLGQCGDVTDGGDEFQVGVGDGAARVPIADQGGLYVGRKGFAPHIRGVAVASGWWEPDAAHAGEGRVAAADVVGGSRHHLGNTGWSGGKVLGKQLQIKELVPGLLVYTDPVVLTGTQHQLQLGE